MLHWFNKTEQMKHSKLRAKLRPNEEWFFITLILTTNKTSYRLYRNVKMTKDVQPTRNSSLVSIQIKSRQSQNMLAIKRVLKLLAYRLQIFLVKYEYLRSLQLCEDQGTDGKLKKCVCKHVFAILTTYRETRL